MIRAGPPLLLLRASGLGDLLTVVPAIHAIRAHRPRRRLVLAIPAWLERFALQAGLGDAVVQTSGLEAPVVRGLEGAGRRAIVGCWAPSLGS
jgi:heme A synthase